MNILISKCLLGYKCRYDGKTKHYPTIEPLLKAPHITLIPICPEVAGGLTTPRDPAEQRDSAVITSTGRDVTAAYARGAQAALQLARTYDCQYAILKERSPSCGSGHIYDGTFSHTLVAGDGVTTAVLKAANIHIIGESDTAALAALAQP